MDHDDLWCKSLLSHQLLSFLGLLSLRFDTSQVFASSVFFIPKLFCTSGKRLHSTWLSTPNTYLEQWQAGYMWLHISYVSSSSATSKAGTLQRQAGHGVICRVQWGKKHSGQHPLKNQWIQSCVNRWYLWILWKMLFFTCGSIFQWSTPNKGSIDSNFLSFSGLTHIQRYPSPQFTVGIAPLCFPTTSW